MNKKNLILYLCSASFLLIFASVAYSATPGTNATLDFVENFTSGIGDKLL